MQDAPSAAINPPPGPGPQDLTDDEKAALRARFSSGEACKHCGGLHARACPRVRRMLFHADGKLAEVDFWADGQWSDAYVIWPEQVADA